MFIKPHIFLFSPTRLINSIKHEHSYKILYLLNMLPKRKTSRYLDDILNIYNIYFDTGVYRLDFFCSGSSVLFTVVSLSLLYLLFIS